MRRFLPVVVTVFACAAPWARSGLADPTATAAEAVVPPPGSVEAPRTARDACDRSLPLDAVPPDDAFWAKVTPGATLGAEGVGWRPGCPLSPSAFAALTFPYWQLAAFPSADSAPRKAQGTVIVHRDAVEAACHVFATLYDHGVPMTQVTPVQAFASPEAPDATGSDAASMEANNTSAYNCRAATGRSRYSAHAYGMALDINPLWNPYVGPEGNVEPGAGVSWVGNGTSDRRPMAAWGGLGVFTHPEHPVVRAFAAEGWTWGGLWRSRKDFQHFTATGR
ncbi:MAG: hypothetical protein RLZZ383_1331 [Pseudomonadota bacterium]